MLDKCANCILIAGSCTPLAAVALIQHWALMVFILCFVWMACLIGIHVEHSHPTWRSKSTFELCMCPGIGWVAALVPREVVQTMAQVKVMSI